MLALAPVEVRTLKVAAGERGSNAHTLMREVSDVLVRHSETLRLEALESRNSSEAISAINSRTVDLAIIESVTPAYISINLFADLFPDYFLLSSLRDPFLLGLIEEAGIRSIGLRIVPIAQAEAMALKGPYLEAVKIVKGAFDGQVPLPREDLITPSL